MASVIRLVGPTQTIYFSARVQLFVGMRGNTHAKSHLVPALIALLTLLFQLLFVSELSTLKVGTNVNELGRVMPLPVARVSYQFEPKLTYGLPVKKLKYEFCEL